MTEDERPIGQLAEDYLSALESEVNEEELEGAKERLSEVRERYERFKSDYGESDPATQELGERLQEAEERVKQLEEAQRVPEELREQVLEAATGFTLSEEWLKPEVIEALNQALIGERDSVLVVEETEITGPDEAENLDDLVRFDIIDVVRKLAMDKLGGSEDVADVWGSIAGTTKEHPFRTVAKLGEATPDDVLGRVDDDDLKRETVRNRLKNATTLDINPYHRESGTYRLSTTGKYLAKEYAEVEADDAKGPVGASEERTESQRTLNQTAAGQGSDTDE
ncbi:hypothetical protein [Halobacterium rubrum]|uniref:hypothetical protein n=1 Tax=Halobacterium TaxID=2239 RepID=UPI001F4204E6|nr:MULTISPECIES: hypothetical protein [Halobacterium]MDH5020353.1 hypothetical protein [Halobacterium rubrum]